MGIFFIPYIIYVINDRYIKGFDGFRKQKWHNGSSDYGLEYKIGDVIGVGVEITKTYFTKNKAKFIFYLNGESMGIAFDNQIIHEKLYPAMTLESCVLL